MTTWKDLSSRFSFAKNTGYFIVDERDFERIKALIDALIEHKGELSFDEYHQLVKKVKSVEEGK